MFKKLIKASKQLREKSLSISQASFYHGRFIGLKMAAHALERKPLMVKIEVSGGVASVTKCPRGVVCQIIDHDDANS